MPLPYHPLEDVKRCLRDEAQARVATREAMRRARNRGITLAMIARASGLTIETVRRRLAETSEDSHIAPPHNPRMYRRKSFPSPEDETTPGD